MSKPASNPLARKPHMRELMMSASMYFSVIKRYPKNNVIVRHARRRMMAALGGLEIGDSNKG